MIKFIHLIPIDKLIVLLWLLLTGFWIFLSKKRIETIKQKFYNYNQTVIHYLALIEITILTPLFTTILIIKLPFILFGFIIGLFVYKA